MKRTIFNEDHEDFRQLVRSFVERSAQPNAELYIGQRHVDRDLWLEAGKHGFLGLDVPAIYRGGEAGDYRFNAALSEELARSNAAPSSAFGIQ